jgi:tRNA (cmo5U34)-methyltransferase
MKKNAGDKIKVENASWSFGKKVPKKFDNHIKKSVPLYTEAHDLAVNLSDFFLKENSRCYDLGCSTGTLIKKISERHNKKIKFLGIDSVKEMITQANLLNKKNNKKTSNKINFKVANINKIKLEKNDLTMSFFTIQFIKTSIRQELVNKIYKSLNWGGCFLFFDKIRANDARFQDIFNNTYNEFKINNNFTAEEIIQKTRSLKGVMEPFSDKGNLGILKRSGFVDIIPIFQWLCFKGYMCIK